MAATRRSAALAVLACGGAAGALTLELPALDMWKTKRRRQRRWQGIRRCAALLLEPRCCYRSVVAVSDPAKT